MTAAHKTSHRLDMTLAPLLEGNIGRFEESIIYAEDPEEMMTRFRRMGQSAFSRQGLYHTVAGDSTVDFYKVGDDEERCYRLHIKPVGRYLNYTTT